MRTVWSQWRSRWAAFAHDLLSIPVAWLGAYWLRFNLGEIPTEILSQALLTLPWVVLFQASALWIFGLYRGVWRFASIPDLIRIVKAIAMGSLMTFASCFLSHSPAESSAFRDPVIRHEFAVYIGRLTLFISMVQR